MTIYVFFDSYPNVYQRVSPNLKMFIFIPPADGMTIPIDQLTGPYYRVGYGQLRAEVWAPTMRLAL